MQQKTFLHIKLTQESYWEASNWTEAEMPNAISDTMPKRRKPEVSDDQKATEVLGKD